MDNLKLAGAALAVVAGIAGFYGWHGSVWIPWLIVVVAFGLAAGLALWTALGRRVVEFVKEAQLELRKVVWPTGREASQSTVAVIGLVLAVALFLWLVDLGLIKAVKAVTGAGV